MAYPCNTFIHFLCRKHVVEPWVFILFFVSFSFYFMQDCFETFVWRANVVRKVWSAGHTSDMGKHIRISESLFGEGRHSRRILIFYGRPIPIRAGCIPPGRWFRHILSVPTLGFDRRPGLLPGFENCTIMCQCKPPPVDGWHFLCRDACESNDSPAGQVCVCSAAALSYRSLPDVRVTDMYTHIFSLFRVEGSDQLGFKLLCWIGAIMA